MELSSENSEKRSAIKSCASNPKLGSLLVANQLLAFKQNIISTTTSHLEEESDFRFDEGNLIRRKIVKEILLLGIALGNFSKWPLMLFMKQA